MVIADEDRCVAEIWVASRPDHQCTRIYNFVIDTAYGNIKLCWQHRTTLYERQGVWVITPRHGSEFVRKGHILARSR